MVFFSLHSCRKRETAQPVPASNDTTAPAALNLPTKDMEGEYVWHRADTPSGVAFPDGIKVLNDTVIVFTSDERYYKAWGGTGIYYHYSQKNDSEVVYGDPPYTITYKFRRGLIIQSDRTSQYAAVIGASSRWKAIQDARISALRNWRRTCHYFVYNSVLKDTIVTLPDTLADAFGLAGYPSVLGYDDLQFSGADSTHAFYREYTFGAGPYKLTTTVVLDYYAAGDTIHINFNGHGAFASNSWYHSY